MARLLALGVLASLLGAICTSADPSACSGDLCEGGSDSSILMQKRVEVSDERITSDDQMYTEDQIQSGAFDITLISDDKLTTEDQMRADTYDIKDFEKVDAEVEEMVRSGKRPDIQNMQKVKTMVQAMNKELIAAHKAAQDELFTLSNGTQSKPMSASKTNRNALQAQQNIKSTIEVQVVGAAANHSSCRAAEAPLNASKIEHCTRLEKFASEITLPAAMPTSKTPALMGPYVKAMSDYYVAKSSSCETKHDIFQKLDAKCTEAMNAYDAKRKECNAYQARYEADFCEWRTKLTDECARYLDPTTGTYSTAVKAYEVKEAATKALAGTKEEQQQGTSTWKTEYAGIKKILCYVDVWMNDNNANTVDKAQLQACKKTVDTSPMDVTYPGVACSVACSTTPVENHPGTQGFAAEYAKLTQKVDAVMPCLKDVARGLPGGPAPVAPTPAPELPPGFPSPSPFPGELPPLTLFDQSKQGEEEDEESGTEAGAWKLLFCGHCGSVGTTWKTHPDLAGCEGHCQGMGKKLLIYNPAHKNCRCYEDGHCSSNKASSCGGGYVYKLSQTAAPTPAPATPVPATPVPATPRPIPQETAAAPPATPIPQQSAPPPQQSAPANQKCYQENYGF